MKRFFLVFFLIITLVGGHAQRRQLGKILSDLNSGESAEAYKRIVQLEASEGKIPETYYARYLFHKSVKNSIHDIDSAYESFIQAYTTLSSLEQKEKDKLCKDFLFCESNKDSQSKELEDLIFERYTSSRSKELILDYQKKYPQNIWFRQSILLIDSLDYETIRNKRIITTLEQYIASHRDSKYNDAVQQSIYQIAFENAKSTDTPEAFEKFLMEYNQSPQIDSAKLLLESAVWRITTAAGTKKDFESYIGRFPSSVYAIESQKRIEQLAWNDAEKQNTAFAYADFINEYPNSSQLNEAKRRYDAKRDNVFPYLTQDKKYMLYDIDSKKFRTQEVYENIVMLNEGKFIVSKYKKVGVVDKNGEVILPLTYNCISVLNDSMLNVQLGDKYALYSSNGKKYTDFLYSSIGFDKNHFITSIREAGDTGNVKYDVYNVNGRLVHTGIYQSLSIVHDSLYLIKLNQVEYLVNNDGKMVSQKYQSLFMPENELMIVSAAQKQGIVRQNGLVVLPLLYEMVSSYDSSLYFIVSNKNSQQGLVNSKGLFLINFQPKSINSLGENMFALQSVATNGDEDQVLFDAQKRTYISSDTYTWINSFKNGYALAGKKGKAGMIDKTGKWVISPLYDEDMRYAAMESDMGYDREGDELYYLYNDVDDASNNCFYGINGRKSDESASVFANMNDFEPGFFDGLAVVKLDSLYGYVNQAGDVKIPIIYSVARSFHQGLANVLILENGIIIPQVIDQTGKVIVNNASVLKYYGNNQRALISKGAEFYVLNFSDKKLSKLRIKAGHENLDPVSEFFVSSFKEKNVIVLSSGVELMDPNIDFSFFDFKKKVENIRLKYYEGNYDEAISSFQVLLNQHPRDFGLNYSLAMCYFEKKDNGNYKYYLSNAIDIRPEDTDLRTRRMDFNYENKNYRDVISDLNLLISSSTYFDGNLYFKRAYANSEMGNESQAFEDYNLVIKNDKTNSLAYNNRGVIYKSRQLYALALTDFNSAVLNGNSTDKDSQGLYYMNKGNVLLALSRKPEACAAWKKAESLGNPNVRANINRYCSSK